MGTVAASFLKEKRSESMRRGMLVTQQALHSTQPSYFDAVAANMSEATRYHRKGDQPVHPDALIRMRRYSGHLESSEIEHKLPRGLLHAIGLMESGYYESFMSGKRPSQAGAVGVMGLMPLHGKHVDRTDIGKSINYAGGELAIFLRKYKGDLPKALTAYNYGAARFKRNYGVDLKDASPENMPNLARETKDYIKSVTSMLQPSTKLPMTEEDEDDINFHAAPFLARQ